MKGRKVEHYPLSVELYPAFDEAAVRLLMMGEFPEDFCDKIFNRVSSP